MRTTWIVAAAAAGLVTNAMPMTAEAYEFGSPGYAQKPGLALGGATAGTPPPGVYMFEQFFTYQAHLTGPGAPNVNGQQTSVSSLVNVTGFVFVPGWNFLGATYNAVLAVPLVKADVGSPSNLSYSGMHNTYIVPVELSWRLGNSGVFVKTGLGIYVPDGTTSGANGLGNVGSPWWTFQPELIVSYLKDGWNVTANLFYEINTKNTVTGYRSGDVLHAEFTATKRFDKWTLGPVAYYAGQVTNDTSSAFYGYAVNAQRYELWSAGLLVGYDFGPLSLNVWAMNEFSARASGGTAAPPGFDSASITKGYTVVGQLNFRLWGPETSAAPRKPTFK